MLCLEQELVQAILTLINHLLFLNCSSHNLLGEGNQSCVKNPELVTTFVIDLFYSTSFFLTGAKIQQQLAKIYNNVKKLQHQLKDAKPTPDCK